GRMPEMPEAQGLVDFLAERTTGLVLARITVSAISALKTYDPPLDDLVGRPVVGAHRHGKFVDLAFGGAADGARHLVFHLAKAGWLRWYEQAPATPVRPGRSPIALRAVFDDGS